MANERKTEAIVRNHFNKFSDTVTIEEQSSDNPRIRKLLRSASKAGYGAGYPEFIISYKENPDLLIIVECKASVLKHESSNHDKPSEYAVDGVWLYASHLVTQFDVLTIAVSGDDKNSKISHYFHFRDNPSPR